MIARNESSNDIWARIAAPVPVEAVQWRQQGKAKARDGKYSAPFVAYIDAQLVRDRLDGVVPGEWDLTLELLPTFTGQSDDEYIEEPVAFKARLQILGVIREDVGTGRDYKTAATDAFKRAAVRFGVGHELYTDYEIIYVEVDGDGKYARPLQDPATVWAKKRGLAVQNASVGNAAGKVATGGAVRASQEDGRTQPSPAPSAPSGHPGDAEPSCPKCGGRMWDNRVSKRNPKAPDYKCRSRSCDGVVWPAKSQSASSIDEEPPVDHFPHEDGLPF